MTASAQRGRVEALLRAAGAAERARIAAGRGAWTSRASVAAPAPRFVWPDRCTGGPEGGSEPGPDAWDMNWRHCNVGTAHPFPPAPSPPDGAAASKGGHGAPGPRRPLLGATFTPGLAPPSADWRGYTYVAVFAPPRPKQDKGGLPGADALRKALCAWLGFPPQPTVRLEDEDNDEDCFVVLKGHDGEAKIFFKVSYFTGAENIISAPAKCSNKKYPQKSPSRA